MKNIKLSIIRKKLKLAVGKNNPNYKHGYYIDNKTCIDCGIKISPKSKGRCLTCTNKYMGRIKIKKIYKCNNCRKQVSDNKAKYCRKCRWELHKYKKFHCIDCDKQISKSKNVRCKKCHGIYSRLNINPKYPRDFKNIRIKIRLRDNIQCQFCFKSNKENGRQLDVHHIDYNKQNCDENNLITLCLSCHTKTNYNRDFWYAYCNYCIVRRNNENNKCYRIQCL